jgi:hypothetical protein
VAVEIFARMLIRLSEPHPEERPASTPIAA